MLTEAQKNLIEKCKVVASYEYETEPLKYFKQLLSIIDRQNKALAYSIKQYSLHVPAKCGEHIPRVMKLKSELEKIMQGGGE